MNKPLPMLIHPLALVFPPMSAPEYEDLKDSLRRHGFIGEKIVTLDGKILDGKERYRACLETAVEPQFETLEEPGPDEDPLTVDIGPPSAEIADEIIRLLSASVAVGP